MPSDKGIEIPIVLNADGSVEGLEAITQGLEKIRAAATAAGSAVDKVGGGPKRAGGPSREPEGTSWWESRAGQLTQSVVSAGLTFVERAVPKMFDPFSSTQEKMLEQASMGARLTAQQGMGAQIQAINDIRVSQGVAEIPQAIQQQMISLAGTFAEEATKRMTMLTRMELEGARRGAEGTLMDFANVGMLPDQETIVSVLQSHQQLVRRQVALRMAIAEGANSLSLSTLDPSTSKQLNASAKDAGGALTTAWGGFGGAWGGGG